MTSTMRFCDYERVTRWFMDRLEVGRSVFNFLGKRDVDTN